MRAAIGAAAGLGLALGLAYTSESGVAGGQSWLFVLLGTCVFLGWFTAQLSSGLPSLLFAPALVLVMTVVLLGVKLVRWPTVPLVGDDFEIFVVTSSRSVRCGAASLA